jgi:hypothetical protein
MYLVNEVRSTKKVNTVSSFLSRLLSNSSKAFHHVAIAPHQKEDANGGQTRRCHISGAPGQCEHSILLAEEHTR